MNQQKSTDTLDLARSWDLKIILASEMLEFCKKHMNRPPVPDLSSKEQGNSRKLLNPFIKVVDSSFKYRTNFKELPEWPELHLGYQPELCPFYKKRDRKAALMSKVTANAEANLSAAPSISQQKSMATNTTMNFTNGRFYNDKCTVLTTPNLTTTLNIGTKSIQNTNNAQAKIAKRKLTFCEICHKEYDDFEKVSCFIL